VENVGVQQSIGVSFSYEGATTITAIDAYTTNLLLRRFGGADFKHCNLRIMADTNDVPSGTFLYSTIVALDPNNPISLNSLSWSIAGGVTYWLTAIAMAHWEYGASAEALWPLLRPLPAYGIRTTLFPFGLPEAEIFCPVCVPMPESNNGSGSGMGSVPEPSTWAYC
jgi:hypothetical protein